MSSEFISRLWDKTSNGLERALDVMWARNQAIVSNITNAETPQYRAVDYNFAGELDRAFERQSTNVQKTDPRHLDTTDHTAAHFIPDYSGATRADGNNVDIDAQMAKLAFNSERYSSAAGLMGRKLATIKRAIQEGGR